MRKKIYIAIYTACVILFLGLLIFAVTTIRESALQPLTPEESADTALGQYLERASAPVTTEDSGTSTFLSVLPEVITGETLSKGCGLRLSFSPTRKVVESGDSIEYAVHFANKGDETCTNVSLSAYYGENEEFVHADPAPTASDYYWAIGDLSSGKTYTIKLATRTSDRNGSDMIPEAYAAADNSADVCSQNIIFVEENASDNKRLSAAVSITAAARSVWGKLFSRKEFGIWVWDSPMKMTSSYAEQVLQKTHENGFNVIYLSIDDYIPISQTQDDTVRAQAKQNYMQALSVFITAAHASGLEVDAVGGAKDWAIPENRWEGYTLIDFVKEYNERYPAAAFRTLQYDVEPYLLPDYEIDKKTILEEYVGFIDESARRMQGVPAGFSIVIPHFYDSDQKWTPRFEYNGENSYTFTHLLEVLRQKQNTTIIIMSYRNFFTGENGTREISQAELREASDGNYNTKIVVAQETGSVTPDYVTFYGQPKSALFDALADIQDYFGSYQNFGGVAVHYFDSFLNLE